MKSQDQKPKKQYAPADHYHMAVMSYFLIVVGIVAATVFLTFVYAVHGLNGLVRFKIGPINFHFDSMPVILISSIVGFAPAMVSFLFLFIGSVVIDIERSYTVFVYLIAIIISFVAVRKKWYSEDVPRLSLLPALLAFILGDVQMVLASLTRGHGLVDISFKNVAFFFLGELPECVIAVAICYCFLIKSPERVRMLTGTGRLYTPGIEHVDMFAQIRTSKLSRFVMGLIIVEGLVLGFAASAFANALLPSVGDEAFSEKEGNFFEDIMNWDDGNEEEGDFSATEDTIVEDAIRQRKRHRRFVLNRVGIAFDIKLIMLLLNTTVPFVVLANVLAHRILVAPIIAMSKSINEFCDVPQDKKEEKLARIRSLPIINDDEIGDLYISLNQMATSIVSFVDEEREKEKLAADLRIAQKTSENKSQFLSNVSHELRTPINAVLGLDEMILRESREENILGYATDIQNAGKTLLSLVNDILDSSKLDEGKMELIPTEYELSSMINDLVNMISVKAKDKNLALEIDVDEETPHILYGDEIRLKQVILNILTNAVKYTEKGGVGMEVGFEKINDEYIYLTVSVKDSGIGIKEEDIEKLFSRFDRIEEERNKNIEGTGLGMNIVQQLLALMESKLEVESVYGEGSDFSFKVIQKVVKWQPIGNFTEAYKAYVEGLDAYEVPFVAPEAKVLVVDDTPMNLTVIRGLLKEIKLEVVTASSGMEALDLVRESAFDIVFMDQRMPEMDGITTFHSMERLTEAGENRSADAPVIMLTANAVSGSREEFLKEGFSDYLSKPIDPMKLERMIRDYLPPEKMMDPSAYAMAHAKEETALTSDAGGEEAEVASEGKKDATLTEALKGLASIDYDQALKNCGSEELLIEVIKDFLAAVPGKSAAIRDYCEQGDYENYTILVHALKSSSRLLGAMALSEEAAHLEKCGDAAKEGDEEAMQEIAKRTPDMLKLYRSYYNKLTPLISNKEDEDLRPQISEEELSEAMSALRELVDAFDFDSADGVVDMLKDYRMPEGFAEKYEEIRTALVSVDREKLLALLG